MFGEREDNTFKVRAQCLEREDNTFKVRAQCLKREDNTFKLLKSGHNVWRESVLLE